MGDETAQSAVERDTGAAVKAHGSSTPWRHWLVRALFESALIVFSVLVALTVDNWRDRSARLERLTQARTALVDELTFNRGVLAQDKYLPHHQRLLEAYQRMARERTIEQADRIFDGGVHVTPLRDAAWHSLATSDVSNDLAFADRARLAGIYGEQEMLRDFHRTALAVLIAPRSDRSNPAFVRDQVRTIAMYLSDVVATETRLEAAYRDALQQLSGHDR
jgi:hypothetical protein